MYSMRTLREPHSGRNQTPPSLRQVNTTLQGHPMRTRKELRNHKLTRLLFAVLLLCSSLANPLAIAAHPMGNFSISHYAGLRVAPGFIELRYIIDVAEIPTYQEMQSTGIVPKEGDPSLPPYLAKKAESLAAGLALDVNGQSLP